MEKELRDSKNVEAPVNQSPAEMPVHTGLAEAPQKSKTWLWIGFGLILPILAGAAYVFAPRFLQPREAEQAPERMITINPNAKFEILQLPFAEISVPGLSPDGNWMSFPAVDAGNKWDVYYMNVSGNEPRKITSDSSKDIFETDISPDGGRIVYDRWNSETQEYEVCVVSVLGGIARKIAEPGVHPRWRPDGKRIGYIVESRSAGNGSGRMEFRSIRPDGTDPRVDLEESVFAAAGPISFAWSPDGKSIALVRTFHEAYQEIFIDGFESGTKRQLTLDQQNIGGVCWTRDDNIIFSSGKGGNANLWMMPSAGGTAVQITKGSGPDISMKISGDGKKVLYLQQQQVGHLWLADSNGVVQRHVPFGDHDVRSASISPDGKQIAFQMFDPDPLKPVSHLCVVGREGGNPHALTSGNEVASEPKWSPDGRWISYCARSASQPADSERAFLIEAAAPGTPRSLGRARNVVWLDSTSLILHTGVSSWVTTILGGELTRFYEDSTFAVPISGRDFVLFKDFHRGHEGWWIDSLTRRTDSLTARADSAPLAARSTAIDSVPPAGQSPAVASPDSSGFLHHPQNPTARLVYSGEGQITLGPGGKYFLYMQGSGQGPGEVWRRSLPDGAEERLPGTFSGRRFSLSLSLDGREILYVDSRLSSKLVMIENLQ